MATRYTVAPGYHFNYPNEADDKIIKAAGGRSKMPKELLDSIKFINKYEGDDCSDMPKEVRDLYVERGWILTEEIEDRRVVPIESKRNN
jgi:hypothetical protein